MKMEPEGYAGRSRHRIRACLIFLRPQNITRHKSMDIATCVTGTCTRFETTMEDGFDLHPVDMYDHVRLCFVTMRLPLPTPNGQAPAAMSGLSHLSVSIRISERGLSLSNP